MNEVKSPYSGVAPEQWTKVTDDLIRRHPLPPQEMVEVCLLSWQGIFQSAIGPSGFRIGVDVFPAPQIMAYLLHELVPLELQRRHPKQWRRDASSNEKDLVYLPDAFYSVEIKASSHPSKIFGNRSYAQPATATKKSKSGFYLAINFGKFGGSARPELTLIRFGWLDYTDWRGQAAATGQQASVQPLAEQRKLKALWRGPKVPSTGA